METCYCLNSSSLNNAFTCLRVYDTKIYTNTYDLTCPTAFLVIQSPYQVFVSCISSNLKAHYFIIMRAQPTDKSGNIHCQVNDVWCGLGPQEKSHLLVSLAWTSVQYIIFMQLLSTIIC